MAGARGGGVGGCRGDEFYFSIGDGTAGAGGCGGMTGVYYEEDVAAVIWAHEDRLSAEPVDDW